MLYRIALASEDDFDGWRRAARALDALEIESDAVEFIVPGRDGADDLFGQHASLSDVPASPARNVPADFLRLAQAVALHSDPGRFALLYRLLRRLRRERHLIEIVSDTDVACALRMEKDIRRDIHKMKAFVRFRLVTAEPETYAAWFEPSHHILKAAAPFFMKRFAGMLWSILTPKGAVCWDGKALTFGPAVSKDAAPSEDHLEEFWRTYYASIFNPARVMPKAMQAHMPKKYWKNLPEAQLIQPLIREAEERSRRMVQAMPTTPARRVAPVLPEVLPGARISDMGELPAALSACHRCPLFGSATQPVPGQGARDAAVMIVGEQPGDEEDLAGVPFIGPAGKVFDAALERLGVNRQRLYITNAVKHFKFTPRGKRRIHERPNTSEISACRWWLEQEVALVRPRLLVAMGASALRSLTGESRRMEDARGRVVGEAFGIPVLATYHPSYLLRLQDETQKRAAWQAFQDDLKLAMQQCGALDASR